ncbi:repressor LexA [filamentous cyanobacterium LEGE 11480]|uniref:Repressor LexA n=1 Tax=Romeriopsis navalis LEGE 11480 TaxID=2777977 RepID=A0A928VKZ7_9CYAN|nr:S24 family peptidase [Romeriopsis navalis]MBE9028297.1 repressor LexA [Romeriopsis navalis LEGE 11480]
MLSPVLSETLVFIHQFEVRYGVPPSYSDFRKEMGIGQGTIQYRLGRLESRGYATSLKGRNRSLCLTDQAIAHLQSIGKYQAPDTTDPMHQIPFLGEIAAGYLSEPATHNEFMEIATLDPKQHFTLKISGDSMIGVGILNRATAVFKRVPDGYEPRPGQIVAAYVEGFGTTLKRFYREGLNVILEAANPDYPPQRIDTRQIDVAIHGVWTGITIADGV